MEKKEDDPVAAAKCPPIQGGQVSSESRPSAMARNMTLGLTTTTSIGSTTTSTPPSTRSTSTPMNPQIVHEENCSSPYCYVRSRNKQRLKFSASAASIRTTKNGKNSVSMPIESADLPGSPTPLINQRVKTSNKTLSTLRSLQYTGESIDCVDANFVMKHKIEIISGTSKMIKLILAKGKAMKVLRTCKLQIQNIGGHGYTHTIALVCPNLSHTFLLSWITQKKLHLLHRGWPFVRLYSANSATLTEMPSIPKKLRPKEKVPDPKIPEWP